jgi:short-subunit dehydrogenase
MASNRRTALITGASSGIGKALAEEFTKDGYDVVLAARSVKRMEEHAAELQNRYGITATVIASDLEADAGANQLYAEAKNRGITLNALANNAGYGVYGEFIHTALESELAMMQLNMNSLVILTKLFLPDLISTKGKILNLASTAAFQPGPYMAIYFASKAFVLSFTEAIASELEETGVTVTAFCPGPTASGFQQKAQMFESAMVNGKRLPSAEVVARKGYRAMQRGQRVYVPGVKNWLLSQSHRFGPRNLVTRIAKFVSRPVSSDEGTA